MANYDWDDMDNQGNAGLGLLGLLGLAVGGMAVKKAHDKKANSERAKKIAMLQEELNNVRYQLSQKKGPLKSIWYESEIEELESYEKQLIQAINKLREES